MPGVCLCHKEIDRFPSSSTAPKSEILGEEAKVGTSTTKLITPATLKAVVDAAVAAALAKQGGAE